MDRILVKSNEEMTKIIEWAKDWTKINRNSPFVVPIQAVEIELAGEELKFTMVLREDLSAGDMVVFVRSNEVGLWNKWCGCTVLLDEKAFMVGGASYTNEWFAGEGHRQEIVKEVALMNHTFEKQMVKYGALMLFAAYYTEEFEKSGSTVRKPRPVKKGKKKKGGAPKYLASRRYVITEETVRNVDAPKRRYRRCDHEINVRGHYRRYKSGKVVWIRPFRKNVGKRTGEGNTYIAQVVDRQYNKNEEGRRREGG